MDPNNFTVIFFSPEVVLKVCCNGEHIVVCTKEGNRSGEVTLLTLARPQRDHSSLNTKIAFCQLEVSWNQRPLCIWFGCWCNFRKSNEQRWKLSFSAVARVLFYILLDLAKFLQVGRQQAHSHQHFGEQSLCKQEVSNRTFYLAIRKLALGFWVTDHIHREDNSGYCNLFENFIQLFFFYMNAEHARVNIWRSEKDFWRLRLSPHPP